MLTELALFPWGDTVSWAEWELRDLRWGGHGFYLKFLEDGDGRRRGLDTGRQDQLMKAKAREG